MAHGREITPDLARDGRVAPQRRIYPKLRRHIPPANADAVIALLKHEATIAADVVDPAPRSTDPADDYLIALAERERAALVSGDADVLALRGQLPVFSAAEFLEWLGALGPAS